MQAGGENEQTVEQMLKLTNGGDGLPFSAFRQRGVLPGGVVWGVYPIS